MPTITVTAWHPYPQFNWQYKMVSGGGWLSVTDGTSPYTLYVDGQTTNAIEITDPSVGDESSLRCIIGNPDASVADMNPSGDTLAATVKASDPVHVTVNALTWDPNLTPNDATIILEEPPASRIWYVRPENSWTPEANGDYGTTYENAFNGFDEVQKNTSSTPGTAGKFSSGDTLRVSGVFPPQVDYDGSYGNHTITPPDGLSDLHRTTIEGYIGADDSEHPTYFNYKSTTTTSYTLDTGAIWDVSFADGLAVAENYILDYSSPSDWRMLTRVETEDELSSPNTCYRVDGSNFKVHLHDDGDPSARVFRCPYGNSILYQGSSNLNLTDLHIVGGVGWSSGVGLEGKNVTFTRVNIEYSNYAAMFIQPQPDHSSNNVLVDNCIISHAEEGIYLRIGNENDGYPSATDVTVQDCTVEDIGQDYGTERNDSHGIGAQWCIGFTVTGNTINRAKTGVTLYKNDFGGEVRDVLVQGNILNNIDNEALESNSTSSVDHGGVDFNIVFDNNTIDGCDTGLRQYNNCLTTWSNNIVKNCRVRGFSAGQSNLDSAGTQGAWAIITGNDFIDNPSADGQLWINIGHANDFDRDVTSPYVEIDGNDWPVGSLFLAPGKGSGNVDFATWQTYPGALGAFDRNGTQGPPLSPPVWDTTPVIPAQTWGGLSTPYTYDMSQHVTGDSVTYAVKSGSGAMNPAGSSTYELTQATLPSQSAVSTIVTATNSGAPSGVDSSAFDVTVTGAVVGNVAVNNVTDGALGGAAVFTCTHDAPTDGASVTYHWSYTGTTTPSINQSQLTIDPIAAGDENATATCIVRPYDSGLTEYDASDSGTLGFASAFTYQHDFCRASPGNGVYLKDAGGTIGGFTHARIGTAEGLDHLGQQLIAPENEPLFEGCDASEAPDYIAHANVKGMDAGLDVARQPVSLTGAQATVNALNLGFRLAFRLKQNWLFTTNKSLFEIRGASANDRVWVYITNNRPYVQVRANSGSITVAYGNIHSSLVTDDVMEIRGFLAADDSYMEYYVNGVHYSSVDSTGGQNGFPPPIGTWSLGDTQETFYAMEIIVDENTDWATVQSWPVYVPPAGYGPTSG